MTPLRAVVLTILIVLLLLSAGAWGFRYAMEHAPEYREPLVERLEEVLKADVSVRYLKLGWDGLGPAIELHELELRGLAEEPLKAGMLRIGVSVWDLLARRFVPRRLTLEGVSLTAQRKEGKWSIASLPKPTASENASPLQRLSDITRLRVRDSELHVAGSNPETNPGSIRIEQAQLLRRFGRQVLLVRLRDIQDAQLDAEVELRGGQPTEVRFSLADFDLAPYVPFLGGFEPPAALHARRLFGDAALQSTGAGERWQYAAQLDIELRHSDEAQAHQMTIRGPVHGYAGERGVRVDSPRLSVQGESGAWPQQSLWLQFDRSPQRQLRAQAGWLNLADIWPFARDQLPASMPVNALGGVISEVTLDWPMDAENRPSLLAQIAGLSVDMSKPRLSLVGVDGELRRAGSRGSLLLNSRDVLLEWPQALVEPLVLDSLGGTLEWVRAEKGVQFDLPDLSYALAGVDGVGRINGEPDGAWHTELRFLLPDLREARALMPAFWKESLQRWLTRAVEFGELRDGRVRLDGMGGKVRHTEVDLALSQVGLNFAPGWPIATADEAELRIRDLALSVRAPAAAIADVRVADLRADILLRGPGPLRIDADVNADAQEIFALLNESPVERVMGPISRALKPKGDVRGKLGLDVTLKGKPKVQWEAEAELTDAKVDFRDWPSPLENVRGRIQINAEGLQAEDLRAEMNGWPLDIRSTRTNGRSKIRAETSARLDELPDNWPVPPWLMSRLSGPARVITDVAVGGGSPLEVNLRSDLLNAAVALPPPLAKPEGMARLLNLSFEPRNRSLQLSYGDGFALQSRDLGRAEQRMSLRFGSNTARLPAAPGIWVEGHLSPVQLEPWLGVIGDIVASGAAASRSKEPSNQKNPIPFGGVNLQLAQAGLAGQRWDDVGVQVLRSGSSWLVNARSEDVQGQLLVDARAGRQGAVSMNGLTVAGQLDHLNWSSQATGPEKSNGPSGPKLPAALPSLDLRVSRFLLNNEELGPLSLAVRSFVGGYEIESLRVGLDGNPALEVTGQVGAEPVAAPDQQPPAETPDGVPSPEIRMAVTQQEPETRSSASSHLNFRWDTTNAAAWLRAAGADQQLRAARGLIEGAISWDKPEDLENLRINGQLRFRFADGQLVSVEPGAGRLLGLLSVTALPRRFLLDFSDMTESGLSFDEFVANYEISDGIAHTDDLKITTPSLRVEAAGDVQLIERYQNQIVRILPGISHGFTAAATVLGGPAVGLFLLFAQELLDKPLDQVGQVQYRIRGPLDNPMVEPFQ